MMNIVACASDNYTMQCGVLFYSVCKNNVDDIIHFFVITDKLFSEKHKDEIRQTISQFANKQISFIEVTDEQVDHFLQFENSYYTRHVFYRLLMADLLPSDVNKALYLDCDIIVRHSLRDLWAIDIDDYAVGCVHDAQEGKMEQFNRLGYTYDKGYFNSGVLLANIRYWREKRLSTRFADYINTNYTRIVLPDQDVLNAVLKDEKTFLSFSYNLQSGFLWQEKYMNQFEFVKYKDELSSSAINPIILHFSGARPWIVGCIHPYKSEFFKYRDQTIWKNEPLWPNRKSFKSRLIDALRPIGARLGICHIIPDYYDRTLKLKD